MIRGFWPKAGNLIVILTVIICATVLSACEGKKKIQPTMVPKNTSTPTPSNSPTNTAVPDIPKETPTPTISPVPTYPSITAVPAPDKVDGSDFFQVMRLLGQGTRVDTTGASNADLDRCFYVEELNRSEKDAFFEAGFLESEIAGLYKMRVLYYRANGNIYIGEVYVTGDNAPYAFVLFKTAFENKTQITDLSDDFADEFVGSAGFDTVGIVKGKREYLYLRK